MDYKDKFERSVAVLESVQSCFELPYTSLYFFRELFLTVYGWYAGKNVGKFKTRLDAF